MELAIWVNSRNSRVSSSIHTWHNLACFIKTGRFCLTLSKWKRTVKRAEWFSTQLARLMVSLKQPVKRRRAKICYVWTDLKCWQRCENCYAWCRNDCHQRIACSSHRVCKLATCNFSQIQKYIHHRNMRISFHPKRKWILRPETEFEISGRDWGTDIVDS